MEGLADGHRHGVSTEHGHPPVHEPRSRTVDIETALLAKNDHLAGHNRSWLAERGIVALNLMSSPGAGKTSLLERTLKGARVGREISVIEGDQETTFDAQRIRDAGARAIQINTGSGCHLDATMIERGLRALDPKPDSLVFLENVGNLVCPALFDLGERAKVVIISVTEGDDKPLKYPHMFAAADLVVVNKTDLLPYVDFDVDRCARDARRLKPTLTVLPLSVRDGSGLGAWYDWLNAL
ncbi:hydrogenase nickel incorporation protein HypB [Modestobacter sp. DSM 44400]|uniref:hydrogenase nickel incorporation protein HypB n=1 Tax=Modestobacter sp. DSM 44400 TaxID=1550230 RepID=UPI0020C8741C|nr:hydrogenase nickel incorporation protein HypB [Modestobacter sp. DSM 44400]